ncbi:MAG: PQQ-dependent sugar dehydrogenase, partial [Planctomycetales bacterium]
HHWSKDNEEGLLGMAFHPDFKTNGQFYVYYSSEAEQRVSIVSRFQVSKDDPDRADPKSEEIVVKIPQPFSNHNGGSIAFGPDGFLYIALGDGGGRNDPDSQGQNLETWMGSILRIDVNRSQGGKNYAVPKDNPFVNRKKARPEIYAFGFRNVWRLSFDRKTGDLWAADVGQDLWEEINLVKPGGNYGWSIREGSYFFGSGVGAGKASAEISPIDPVWEYDHRVGRSITGGFVYRGKQFPELAGCYLHADYISRRIWALKYDAERGKVVKNFGLASADDQVIAFGEDAAGELYFTSQTTKHGHGVYRFVRAKK